MERDLRSRLHADCNSAPCKRRWRLQSIRRFPRRAARRFSAVVTGGQPSTARMMHDSTTHQDNLARRHATSDGAMLRSGRSALTTNVASPLATACSQTPRLVRFSEGCRPYRRLVHWLRRPVATCQSASVETAEVAKRAFVGCFRPAHRRCRDFRATYVGEIDEWHVEMSKSIAVN